MGPTGTFRVAGVAAASLVYFLLAAPFSPAAASSAAEAQNFIASAEEAGARCISPLPGGYRYLLPDAIRTPFQSPYPPSPVPDAEELAAIRSEAEGGDPEAQLYMGHFYVNGDAVGRDVAAGAAWYRRAAEGGSARARYHLGFLHESGVGVERDYAEAFRWYMKAVEQDDPAAHLGIAGFHFAFRKRYMPAYFGHYVHWRMKAAYLTGDPGPERPSLEECVWSRYHSGARFHQNDLVVAEILRERAIAGDHEATLCLAKMVLHAQGVARDQKLASALVYGAAGQGSETAAYILGAVGMTNDLVDSAGYGRDGSVFLTAAARSNRDTYFVYSWHDDVLIRGGVQHGFIPSAAEVERHHNGMRELADSGYAPAQHRIAWQIYSPAAFYHYLRGGESRADLSGAFELFEKAAAAGHRYALVMAGFMKMFGMGTEQNCAAGQALVEEGVADGDVFAIGNHLPLMKFFCEWEPGNTRKLESFLEERRRAGDAFAALWLGCIAQSTNSANADPMGLLVEALKKGAYPAEYVLRKIDWDRDQSAQTLAPPLSVADPPEARARGRGALLARFPEVPDLRRAAAEDGYGPAILYMLEGLAADGAKLDKEEGRYWLDKYFTHRNWYGIRHSIVFTAKEIDEVYRAVHGDSFPYSLNSGWMYRSNFGGGW